MKKIKIHVGEKFDASAKRVADAWHQAKKGKHVFEDHITFADWDLLAKVMSKQRYALLRYIHRHSVKTVASLARAVKRDYKRVYEDVAILVSAGLVKRNDTGLHADYSVIESRIVL